MPTAARPLAGRAAAAYDPYMKDYADEWIEPVGDDGYGYDEPREDSGWAPVVIG